MKVPEYYMTPPAGSERGAPRDGGRLQLTDGAAAPGHCARTTRPRAGGCEAVPPPLCRAGTETELDEDELEALKPENLLAALARDPAPTQTPPEALEDLEAEGTPIPPSSRSRTIPQRLPPCCWTAAVWMRTCCAISSTCCSATRTRNSRSSRSSPRARPSAGGSAGMAGRAGEPRHAGGADLLGRDGRLPRPSGERGPEGADGRPAQRRPQDV